PGGGPEPATVRPAGGRPDRRQRPALRAAAGLAGRRLERRAVPGPASDDGRRPDHGGAVRPAAAADGVRRRGRLDRLRHLEAAADGEPGGRQPGAIQRVRKPTLGRPLALFAGPIAWFRVMTGTVLAVAGVVSANVILDTVLNASGGRLSTADLWHDQLITWEIKALAVLAGAGLAGANTQNGLKQGLCMSVPFGALLLAQPA